MTMLWRLQPLPAPPDALSRVCVAPLFFKNPACVCMCLRVRAERFSSVQGGLLAAREGVCQVQGSRHGMGGASPFTAQRPRPSRTGETLSQRRLTLSYTPQLARGSGHRHARGSVHARSRLYLGQRCVLVALLLRLSSPPAYVLHIIDRARAPPGDEGFTERRKCLRRPQSDTIIVLSPASQMRTTYALVLYFDLWVSVSGCRVNAAVCLQVHQTLSQQDLARAQSVAKSSLVLNNPDTYGEEVAYWIDTDHPGKLAPLEGVCGAVATSLGTLMYFSRRLRLTELSYSGS